MLRNKKIVARDVDSKVLEAERLRDSLFDMRVALVEFVNTYSNTHPVVFNRLEHNSLRVDVLNFIKSIDERYSVLLRELNKVISNE